MNRLVSRRLKAGRQQIVVPPTTQFINVSADDGIRLWTLEPENAEASENFEIEILTRGNLIDGFWNYIGCVNEEHVFLRRMPICNVPT